MTTLVPACIAKIMMLAAVLSLAIAGMTAGPAHNSLAATAVQWLGRWLVASAATGLLFGQFALGEECHGDWSE